MTNDILNNPTPSLITRTLKSMAKGLCFDGLVLFYLDITTHFIDHINEPLWNNYVDSCNQASFPKIKTAIASTVYLGRDLAREAGHQYLGAAALGCIKYSSSTLLSLGKISFTPAGGFLLAASCLVGSYNNVAYEFDNDFSPNASLFESTINSIRIETSDNVLLESAKNSYKEITSKPENLNIFKDGYEGAIIGLLVGLFGPIYDLLESIITNPAEILNSSLDTIDNSYKIITYGHEEL